MEIERKYLPKYLPENLEQYKSKKIAQGYLCTSPVVRIRRSNDDYYLTYKGGGMMAREEYNLPLTKPVISFLLKMDTPLSLIYSRAPLSHLYLWKLNLNQLMLPIHTRHRNGLGKMSPTLQIITTVT